jgi:hypothetical protein
LNNNSSKKLAIVNFLPGIAWFLFVLILVCLPGETIPQAGWLDFISFDKLVHAGLFGGMAFLFCRPFRKVSIERKDKLNLFRKITLAICLWGLTTEFIQKFFIPGRQFDLMDWAADSLGAILAFFVSRWWFAKAV